MGRQVIQSASLFFSPTGGTRKIVKSVSRVSPPLCLYSGCQGRKETDSKRHESD